jgi:hypothetical protein
MPTRGKRHNVLQQVPQVLKSTGLMPVSMTRRTEPAAFSLDRASRVCGRLELCAFSPAAFGTR